MKSIIIILIFLIFPALVFGEDKNEIRAKIKIAEAVFKYEIEHSPEKIKRFQRYREEYKPTHFAISIDRKVGLTLDESFLSIFKGVTPPVVAESEITCYRDRRTGSYGQFGNCIYTKSGNTIIYPVFFTIFEIKMENSNAAKVKGYIVPGTGDCSFETECDVVIENGEWVVKVKRKYARYVCGT